MFIVIIKDVSPLIRFKLSIWLKVITALVFIWVIYLLLNWHKNYKLISNTKSCKYWLRRIFYNLYFECRTVF